MSKQATTTNLIATTTNLIGTALRKASRENNQMPQGGRHGSPKGKRGYSRKTKHKGRN